MATIATPPVFITEEEYLERSFSPDCDLVEGELKERHVGDEAHSSFQSYLPVYLEEQRKRLGFRVRVEYRLKTGTGRYRVPDIQILLRSAPREPVATYPPFAILEVLSPDDTLEDLQVRCEEYVRMGVAYIWIVNPRRRQAWAVDGAGFQQVSAGVLRTTDPAIEIVLEDVFAGIDQQYE